MPYAIRNDLTGWRMVDGEHPNPENPSWVYPDYEIEHYSETLPPDAIAPEPTKEELTASANLERDSRLAEAAIRIAPLQDAVDLDEATDQEVADLKLWKQYRVLVNRVNAQPGFPSDISWPKRPGQK